MSWRQVQDATGPEVAEGSPFMPDEHETWRRFHAEFTRSMKRHEGLLHPFYKENLDVMAEFRDGIPSLATLNGILRTIGWSARYVEGYTPPWRVAQLLTQRVMPISRSIRPKDEIFFANEPDLIHDLFGHLPTLLHPGYRRLLLRWAQMASRAAITEFDRTHYHLNKLIVQAQDKVAPSMLQELTVAASSLATFSAHAPSSLQIFDKIYFWMFEFAIVQAADGDRRIFGAGILSSLSELATLSGDVATKPLTLSSILSPYNISRQQTAYLVADSESDFEAILAAVAPQPPLTIRSGGGQYAH